MFIILGFMGKDEKFVWGVIDLCLLVWGLWEKAKSLHGG